MTIYAAEPGSPTAHALALLASWAATERPRHRGPAHARPPAAAPDRARRRAAVNTQFSRWEAPAVLSGTTGADTQVGDLRRMSGASTLRLLPRDTSPEPAPALRSPVCASGGRGSAPGPGRLRDARPAPRPIAHRRQPDRARLVQVVRPVGRSTWTSRTRPGRAKLARRDAVDEVAVPYRGQGA